MKGNNRLKSIVIMLAGLSLTCLALLTGASWYANSAHCRLLLLQKLNRVIPGTVTVADHHFSLVTGKLSLKDAAIMDQKGGDIVRVARMDVDLAPAALLRRVVALEYVSIVQPWVSLLRNENNELNIVDALVAEKGPKETHASADDGPSFNIIVNHFSLSSGYVNFTEAHANRQVTLEEIDITAKGSLFDRAGVVKLGIGKTAVILDGHTEHLQQLDLALAVKNGHIEPLVFKAQHPFASLLVYGDVRNAFSDPEFDLSLDVDAAVNAAEAFLNIHGGTSGRVRVLLAFRGRPHNPAADLSVDYGGGTIAGSPIRHAGLTARLTDRVITLDNLVVDADAGLLDLSGEVDLRRVVPKGFLAPAQDWDEAAYQGRLRTASLDLAVLPFGENSLSGGMNVRGSFTGKGLSLEKLAAAGNAEVVLKDFSYGPMQRPVNLQSRANVRMEAGKLRIDDMVAEAAEATVTAGGSMDLYRNVVDARFKMTTPEIAALLSIAGVSQVRGGVALDGHVQGHPTNPDVQVSAIGRDIGIQTMHIGNVALEAGLNTDGRVAVTSLSIDNRGSSLTAEGHLQLFADPFELHADMPLNARCELSNVEFGDFLPPGLKGPDISGSLAGEVALTGSLRALDARADILARGIAVGPTGLGDLTGRATFSNGKLLVERIHLSNRRTDLTVRGDIQLLHPGSWATIDDPAFRLELADGRLFLEDFRDNLAGALKIDTYLEGSIREPRGRIAVEGAALDLAVQKLETLTLDVAVGNRQATIEALDIRVPGGGAIKGEGRLGYDRSYQFSLQTSGLAIDSLDRLRDLKQVHGQLDIGMHGKGTLHRPNVSGDVKWSNIRVRDEALEDLELRFNFKDNRIFLEGRQTSDLSAEYDLSSKAFSVNLEMNDTGLAHWFAIAGRPELGGSISGTIRASGKADDLARIGAAVDIRGLELTFKGDRFAGTHNLQGTYGNGTFSIPVFNLDLLDQGYVAIEGSGAIDGDIDLAAEGEIPLRAANLLAPDVAGLEGNLFLAATVKGSWEDPALEGLIKVQQGGMRIPDLQQSLHAVNGEMRFVANQDVSGSFSGRLDNGKFDLETTVALEGFRARTIDARATASALPLQIPDHMEMLLNADISMNGSPEALLVKGEIVLLEGIYYRDFKLNLMQSVPAKEREAIPPTVEEPNPLLKPLRFDVRLTHRQPFVVDNNIADLEISPDMALTGTAENPVLTGSARVENGLVTYQNKSFEVQQGAVNFVNPYTTEAEIDIKGNIEIRDWRITISLYGPPDRLSVELSSVPHEEEADIISLLVFNKTTYELNEDDSGIGQSPTVLLTRLLATSFGDDVKESVGIDVLEVEAESAADKNSTDRIRVTVGKDLSERMTVKYAVESKDGGYVQRASTEYKLLEHIMVSGFQDTKGVYGGEFIFRVEFRLLR